ncbi:MAG: hypothetical protein FD139_3534, partial [Methylocystaceae bacterium]
MKVDILTFNGFFDSISNILKPRWILTLAYVTAKYAALAPFAKVSPSCARRRRRQCRHGAQSNPPCREHIARLRPEEVADPDIDAVTPAVVIGLDGGCLRSQHRRPERNFEVLAGKVLNVDGSQHR